MSKSNFNDLRQIFDDKRSHTRSSEKHSAAAVQQQQLRYESRHKQQNNQSSMAAMYYDAKPSMGDGDNIFESKQQGSGSQKYDFERAKLKFDRSNGGAAGCASGKGASSRSGTRNSGVASSKRNSGDCSLMEKQNYNEAVQMFDENMKRSHNNKEGVNYMKTSLNLDGLKVSDDEVSSPCPYGLSCV